MSLNLIARCGAQTSSGFFFANMVVLIAVIGSGRVIVLGSAADGIEHPFQGTHRHPQ